MIYFDNAATTKMDSSVAKTYANVATETYGNPSSLHRAGQSARGMIEISRAEIAASIGAKTSEIYFTSGGTESDNWALKGIAEAYPEKKHIITSVIEHHAILHTCEYLERHGYEITYIGVDENGFVDFEELKAAIRPDTLLVSIMAANNEIGSIQPVQDIGKLCHEHGVLFHTDAVQAYKKIDIDVHSMDIDLMSVSAHKVGGPKGIGFLYIRDGIEIEPLLHGGGQEFSLRSGTENTPAIVAFGSIASKQYDLKAMNGLNYEIMTRLTSIKGVHPNGYWDPEGYLTNGDYRICTNANIRIDGGVKAEVVLMLLSEYNICVSAGSACASSSGEPSHVLKAIGLTDEQANSSIRITIGEETTLAQINEFVDRFKTIIDILRR